MSCIEMEHGGDTVAKPPIDIFSVRPVRVEERGCSNGRTSQKNHPEVCRTFSICLSVRAQREKPLRPHMHSDSFFRLTDKNSRSEKKSVVRRATGRETQVCDCCSIDRSSHCKLQTQNQKPRKRILENPPGAILEGVQKISK